MSRFDYIKTNPNSVEKIQKVREACAVLGEVFESVAPSSRELSLALTNLEQAAMWANRAICVSQDSVANDTVNAQLCRLLLQALRKSDGHAQPLIRNDLA